MSLKSKLAGLNNETCQVLCKRRLSFAPHRRTVTLQILSLFLLPSAQVPQQKALPSHVYKPWSANVSTKKPPDSFTDSVKLSPPLEIPQAKRVICPPSPCLDWLLNPEKTEELSDRVLARLLQAEIHEPLAYFKDDYRIAWLIVHFCRTGEPVECTPQVLATYRVLGCHPDQVWPRIIARRQAMLGNSVVVKFPKKPSPVTSIKPKKIEDGAA